jgi:DNA polymerase-3 subunit delta
LKRLHGIAEAGGLSFCFQPLSDEEAVERAKGRLEREGFRVDPEALGLLVESVGTRLIDLANEVEKIVLSADPGSTVTRENVAAVVGRYRTENLFGFLDRLGRDDTATTLSRLNRIIDGGEEPVFVLSMLLRRVAQLLHVRLLMDEGPTSPRSLAGKLAGLVTPFQIAILSEQAKRFDTRGLGVYLDNLRWTDRMIKSSSVEPGHLIELALVASGTRKALVSSNT